MSFKENIFLLFVILAIGLAPAFISYTLAMTNLQNSQICLENGYEGYGRSGFLKDKECWKYDSEGNKIYRDLNWVIRQNKTLSEK